tara:strand:- start:133245 stop:134633 length:1389 start_codon:yes stop_codon:yes gene_type:complete
MKKFQHVSLMLLAFVAIVFSSCDNEPLEGEFITDEPGGEPGSFVATIDGQSFSATQVSAEINQGNLLINGNDGDFSMGFIISNKSECVFDLTGINAGASIGQLSGGAFSVLPFGESGTSGTLEITSYDTDALTVSGTFEFVAVEITQNGPGEETITVTEGSFSSLPFTVTSGDVEPSECVPPGTGGGDPDPVPEPAVLFAKADGVDFVPTDVVVSQYMVGMTPMIQIVAMDTLGASLRLDVPETLATGTFDLFEGISDGSNLIGYYDPNTGSETLSSNPGTITITEFSSFSKKLVATFEFTARDPLGQDPTVIAITEGNLDVSFEPTPGNITFAFEADVDGVNFTADNVTVVDDTFNGVSILTITATMGGETIQLDLPTSATAEGSYGMSPALVTGNEIVGTYLPTTGVPQPFTSDPGTFTITTFDETANVIEGTFSFTAKDATLADPAVYEVTNGTFLIQL